MTTPEVHNLKHEVLDGKIVVVERGLSKHEDRINRLEGSNIILSEQMKNTMTSINNLITWIKWALAIGIGAYVGFFTWLLQQQLIR